MRCALHTRYLPLAFKELRSRPPCVPKLTFACPFYPLNQKGNLGSEPSLRYLDNGNCVLEVSLAVSKDQAPGRAALGEQREVDWIRLTAWGRVAESLAQRAHKGSRMMVVGALTSSSWTDKYGQNRSDVKVRAMHMVGGMGLEKMVSVDTRLRMTFSSFFSHHHVHPPFFNRCASSGPRFCSPTAAPRMRS